MAASTSLEFYFLFDPDKRPARKPLLFHHIPGVTGLGFRHAVAEHFRVTGAGRLEIPRGKAGMKAAGIWPNEFVAAFDRLREETELAAVMSQHTAELQEATTEPILSLMEDPDAFLENRIGVQAAAIVKLLRKGLPADRLLEEFDLANPQARSLTRAKLPLRQPDSVEDRAAWAKQADALAARFDLYPVERYDQFATHCRDAYGLADVGAAEGQKRLQPTATTAIAAAHEAFGDTDPVWFDRMIYARIGKS